MKPLDVFMCGIVGEGTLTAGNPLFIVYFCPEKNSMYSKELGFENKTHSINTMNEFARLSDLNRIIRNSPMLGTTGPDLDKWCAFLLKDEPPERQIQPFIYMMDYPIFEKNLPKKEESRFITIPLDMYTIRKTYPAITSKINTLIKNDGTKGTKSSMVYMSAIVMTQHREIGNI